MYTTMCGLLAWHMLIFNTVCGIAGLLVYVIFCLIAYAQSSSLTVHITYTLKSVNIDMLYWLKDTQR